MATGWRGGRRVRVTSGLGNVRGRSVGVGEASARTSSCGEMRSMGVPQ